MRRLLLLAFLPLVACTAGPNGASMSGLESDPNSGCTGFTASIYGSGYLLHIGAGTGDSGTIDGNGCTITGAGQANPKINPVAGLPGGSTMTVTTPLPTARVPPSPTPPAPPAQ